MIGQHQLSIDYMTTLGATPLEQIKIAQALDAEAISLIAAQPTLPELEVPNIIYEKALHRDLARASKDSGIQVHTMEGFLFLPEATAESFKPMLEMVDTIGIPTGAAIMLDPDRSRMVDRFAEVCDLAARQDFGLNIQFVLTTHVKSMKDSFALIAEAGSPANAGVVVDACHFFRSGDTIADLAAAPAERINTVQLCDGPIEVTEEQYIEEMLWNRPLPGEGEFPLKELVAATPLTTMVGVEVLMDKRRRAGESPMQRAQIAVAAARKAILED